MQANQRVTEISGKPGKVWGNVFVPSSGTISVRIMGDTLQSTLKSGVEKTDSWVRIQNVDSAEIVEAPEYVLLVLGVFLVFSSLGLLGSAVILGLMFLVGGIACIVYAFVNKRRLLVIYSLRYTIPVFMTKPSGSYQQFAEYVMAIARQLNAPSTMSQANKPANNPSPTNSTNRQ
ncbi:MAG: hypothetical protein LH702_07200 [Phormidesmis sp. CAN_BIN44]|nr:hypothetical protein [Phormidesmis sp. CAN_BIN44]